MHVHRRDIREVTASGPFKKALWIHLASVPVAALCRKMSLSTS